MDEIYVTYVDDEHVDNHDYDDTTDDDHDNNNDIYARAFNARVNTSLYINGILGPRGPMGLKDPGPWARVLEAHRPSGPQNSVYI